MKRFLILFSFLITFCLSAHSQASGLADLKFGRYQVADSQWNVGACMYTATCQIYSKNPGTAYKIPWFNGQLTWGAGDYVAFVPTADATNPWNAIQYTSNGTQKAVMGTGHIINMGTDYFFFVGNDNNTGQLFSMTQGFANTSGVTWTGTLNPTIAQTNTYAANGSTTPLAAGQTAAPAAPAAPTVTGTSTAYTTNSVITSPGVTSTYRTLVTTKTWSDGTTTTENGTSVLTNTAVASTITTNKVNGSTLTTYVTPILTNTPADGSTPYISANGQQTSTSQQVQQGLNYKVYDFDAYTYTCTIFGCAKNLLGPYRVPNLTPGAYTANHTGRTTNGVYVPTNGSFPNMGEGTLVAYNGTITAPITTTRPAGTIYRIYFYSNNDDGFVMKLNGHTVIDDRSTFQLQALGNGYTADGWMDLVAGQTYNFEAWYWQDTGGYGLNLKWDIGGGRTGIPNSAFTTGTLGNVVIDTTGLAYTNDAIVPVAGLCCGGSATPFDANSANTAKVINFVNRTTADSKVFIEQLGTQNVVLVEQSGTRNNYVNYYGDGLSNNVEIKQQGNASTQINYVDLQVIGNFNTVKIEQTSTGGAKGAFVNVQDNNNSLTLKQQDNGSHYAEVNLSGGNKTVDILQQGSAGHMASVTLTGPQPSSLNLIQAGTTQQYYSITNNCTTAGGCAAITVTQGQ
jgi:hypothetical protein